MKRTSASILIADPLRGPPRYPLSGGHTLCESASPDEALRPPAALVTSKRIHDAVLGLKFTVNPAPSFGRVPIGSELPSLKRSVPPRI